MGLIISGAVLAVVGFEFGDKWPYHLGLIVGVGGTNLTIFAAIRQFREARPFTCYVSESSWKPLADQFVLEIPESEHRKGRTPADPTVYFPTASGGYEVVECGVEVTASGTVRITIGGKPFSGRVVIK